MARTSTPWALENVYSVTGLPCGVAPKASFFMECDVSARDRVENSAHDNSKKKTASFGLRKAIKISPGGRCVWRGANHTLPKSCGSAIHQDGSSARRPRWMACEQSVHDADLINHQAAESHAQQPGRHR